MALLLSGGIGLQLFNPLIMRYFIDTAREGWITAATYPGGLVVHWCGGGSSDCVCLRKLR